MYIVYVFDCEKKCSRTLNEDAESQFGSNQCGTRAVHDVNVLGAAQSAQDKERRRKEGMKEATHRIRVQCECFNTLRNQESFGALYC